MTAALDQAFGSARAAIQVSSPVKGGGADDLAMSQSPGCGKEPPAMGSQAGCTDDKHGGEDMLKQTRIRSAIAGMHYKCMTAIVAEPGASKTTLVRLMKQCTTIHMLPVWGKRRCCYICDVCHGLIPVQMPFCDVVILKFILVFVSIQIVTGILSNDRPFAACFKQVVFLFIYIHILVVLYD